MSSTVPPAGNSNRVARIPFDNSLQLEQPDLLYDRDGRRRSDSDLHQLLQIFRRHRTLMISVFLVVLVLGAVATLIMPAAYTADATVLFDPRKRQVVSSEPVLGRPTGDSQVLDTVVESELQRILSRRVIDPVIDQLQLSQDPEFIEPLSAKWEQSIQAWSFLPSGVRSTIDDAFRLLGLQPKPQDTASTRQIVMTTVLKRLKAEVQGHSTTIKITFWSENPAKAAAIVNAIADHYVQLSVQESTAAVRDALAILNLRSDELRTKASETETAAEKFRTVAHLIEDTHNGNLNSSQITQTTAQLLQARGDLATAEARVIASQSVAANTGASPDVLNSPVIQRLREEEAKEASALAEATSRSGSVYPLVIAHRAALYAVRSQIQAEIANIIRGNEAARDGAVARVTLLRNQLSDMWQGLEHNSAAEIQYHELKVEADVRHSLYEGYLRRIQEISQQLGTAQPDAQVLSEAETPIQASWPNKRLLFPAIAFLAVVLSAGSAVLSELLGKGFQSLERAKDMFGDQSFLLVPRVRAGRRGRSARGWSAKPSGAYAEAIHSLRIQLRSSGPEFRTVLFASAVETEGKTTTPLSYARQEALAGLKVLVIDADLRRPVVQGIFGGSGHGLVDLLAGEKSFDQVLQFDSQANLTFMSAGNAVSSPIDLLSTPKMVEVLREAAARFDRIIVDSPAVLAVADARVLTGLVDRTVYIIQWRRTPRNLALTAFDMLRRSGGSMVGPVFVQVDGGSEVYGGSSYVKTYMAERPSFS